MWKRTIVSKIEIKLQFPFMVQAQYEHRITADAIYNTTVHKNKSTGALNVANVRANMPQVRVRPKTIFKWFYVA